jgi:hypothetical protein
MGRLLISFDNNPEYIRPLIIRISSDDHKIDKYAGIQDWADPEQLQKLFKNWLKLIKEINIHEATTLRKHPEPLSEVVGLPWDRHKRANYER